LLAQQLAGWMGWMGWMG